jgi:multisubunit Na+/H+ antiporter MnhB subunit
MSVVVEHVSRLLWPVCIAIALGILVKGYTDVGDGFSAGVICALGAFTQYVSFGRERGRRMVRAGAAPLAAALGLALVLATVLSPVLFGHSVVTHFPGPGAEVVHVGTLELLTAMVFDVGVFFAVWGTLVLIIDNLLVPTAEAP